MHLLLIPVWNPDPNILNRHATHCHHHTFMPIKHHLTHQHHPIHIILVIHPFKHLYLMFRQKLLIVHQIILTRRRTKNQLPHQENFIHIILVMHLIIHLHLKLQQQLLISYQIILTRQTNTSYHTNNKPIQP